MGGMNRENPMSGAFAATTFRMWQRLGVENCRTGLLDGSLPLVRILSEQILPLADAQRRNDRFAVARIVRERPVIPS
jgi:hypothetical protein